MTFQERGMYLEMLLEQWEKGSVPSSAADLKRSLGGTEKAWSRAWPKLSACFNKRKRDGRLVNAKLEAVRRDRLKFKKLQAESGLKGAAARWQKHGKPIGSPSKANGEPIGHDGSDLILSDRSSSSSSSSSGTPKAAGRQRPIFTGQRLVVFPWQLENLKRMLGPLVDEFNLPEWFATLDAHAAEKRIAIPQRSNGAWLEEQTYLEVQRRGLPIAVSPSAAAGKQTTRLQLAHANIRRESMQ
jgi:hypothetical protein